MLTWLSALALGGPLAAAPGAGLAVPPCTPELDCWDRAPVLAVFGPAPSERGEALRLDVRVGRDDAGLWVEVPELPAGARLEWVLQPDDDREDPTWGGLAQLWHLEAGTHHLQTPLIVGEARAFRVQLLLPPGEDGLPRTYTWRPAGIAEPASLWSELWPGSGTLGVTWSREGCAVSLSAPGATRWRVESRPAGPRWHGRSKERAVRLDGEGSEADLGCVSGDLTAFVTDGERAGFSRLRLAPEVEAPSLEGLAPVPRTVETDGGTLQASRLTGFAGPEAQAALLQREWQRVVHQRLAPAEPGPGVVYLSLDEALPAQSFALELEDDRARVRAGSPAALSWGTLALVDLMGFDGSAPTGHFADAPALLLRPLVHRLDGGGRQPLDVQRYQDFLDRVVLRGRYTHLVLDLRARFPWSDPELRRQALEPAELDALVAHARSLGLEVLPGFDPFGDVQFVLQRHRTWGEDGDKQVRSARQPASLAFVRERALESQQAFGTPGAWWLDLQWVGWATQHKRGSARTQRTAATPRWVLLGEELAQWAAWTRAEGITPWMGTGMVLAHALGGRLGTERSLDALTPEDRARFVWLHDASHTRAQAEAERAGLSLVRLHRGLDPANRPGLDGFVGEGLWTNQFEPWSAAPDKVGEVGESGHWSRVWLTGVTGWLTELAEQDADGLLDRFGELVALHPGERPSGKPAPLGTATALRAGDTVVLDDRLLTWALDPTWEQEARWADARKRSGASPVARLSWTEDGEPRTQELYWGQHVERGRLEGIVVPAWEAQQTRIEPGLPGWTWTTLRLERSAEGATLEALIDLQLVR